MALEPHQLGEVIGQRQLELSAAMKATAMAKDSAHTRVAEFDTYASKINEDFKTKVAALVAAQTAAASGFADERTALVDSLADGVAAATAKLAAIQKLLDQAVAAQATPTAAAPAAPTPMQVQQTQQQAPVLPTVLLPMPQLPDPVAPEEAEVPHFARAMVVLDLHQCQHVLFPLLYSDVGLDPVLVARLVGPDNWTQMYPTAQPSADMEVPPRVLGCLRMALARAALSYTQETTEQLCKAREAAQAAALAAIKAASENHASKRPRTAAPSSQAPATA
jgi:hypothetical protein